MTTWAVVPVKSFARAKSRLAPLVPAAARARLARALCSATLTAVARAPGVDRVLVATDSDEVAEVALAAGAAVVRESAPGHLAEVVNDAVGLAFANGAGAALVLMADLPLLTASAVERLVFAHPGSDVVLCPDRRREGTNALLLRRAWPIPAGLGRPQSFDLICAGARAYGLATSRHVARELAVDLDTPRDLVALRAQVTSAGARRLAQAGGSDAARHAPARRTSRSAAPRR